MSKACDAADLRRTHAFSDSRNAVLSFLTRSYWVWFTLGCLLVAVVSFWKLGVPDIFPWDEARHGVNAYEMIQSKSYLLTTYRYQPDYYNLKPPLSVWMIMLGYRLLGYSALGMRFYSALAYLATAIIVSLDIKKHHGAIPSLLVLPVFSACDMYLGLHMARSGDADALFMLFYTISMFSTLRWLEDTEKPKHLYSACFCFSLAFLARSWHAGCIPLTMLAALLCTGKGKALKLKNCLIGLTLALGPILLWAAARYTQDGMAFFAQMFQYDLVDRSATAIEAHGGGIDFYIAYILGDPFSCVMLATCAFGLIAFFRQKRKLSSRYLYYLLWFALPIVLFSFITTKMDWYIFPAMLPLLIVFAVTLGKALTASHKPAVWASAALCLVLVIGAFSLNSLKNVHDWYLHNDQWGLTAFLKTLSREADYTGKPCYLDSTAWTQDTVLQSELSADLRASDGGTSAFAGEAAEGALLILERSQYENAAPRCAYQIAAENDDWVMLMKVSSSSPS